MNNNHHNFFKKYFCGSQLCVMCLALICIFLVVCVYNNFQSPQGQIIILPQEDFRDDDTVSKLENVYSETELKTKLPDKLDKNKISSQKDSNQQKQDIDQQKVTKPDKPGNVIENKPSQEDSNQQKQDINQQKVVKHDKPANVIENKPSQKHNNQQKANGKPDQLSVPGMNATHINGILMEPVNVDYTRNIYFSIKTTHRYYTERLFLIMLTWLQVVDKNKVGTTYLKSSTCKIYLLYKCEKPSVCPCIHLYFFMSCR